MIDIIKKMIQKLLAHLYQKRVTKTYNDNNDGFICNFVLTYKDENENYHNVSCYSVNFEPIVIGKENLYYVELDVHSIQNIKFNNKRDYLNQAKVLKMDLLINPWEIDIMKKEIEKYYNKQNS